MDSYSAKYAGKPAGEVVWSKIDQDINGAFNCEYDVSNFGVHPKVSWACFKIKEVRSLNNYAWRQPCIYVEWDCETGRQLVFIFGFLHSAGFRDAMAFIERTSDFEERRLNPFVWHRDFAKNILEKYDTAFWLLRDVVRKQEKAWLPLHLLPFITNSIPQQERGALENKTTFLLLHDIAHLIHYQETIEVAEHTLHGLVTAQEHWRQEDGEMVHGILGSWLNTHQGLLFEGNRAHSLKCRVKSLSDRHMNEINLAFNIVSQTSGQAVSSDTAMMMTFLVLSFFYLPGIFVSGIFGMNFFGSKPNAFTISSEFWIYWATTIPLTTFTILVWAGWNYRKNLLSLVIFYKDPKTRHDSTDPGADEKSIPRSQWALSRPQTGLMRRFKQPDRTELV